MSTTYQRRKAQGLCVWCEAPVTPPHVYCEACRAHTRAHHLPVQVRAPVDERNLLAHCGRWWPVAQIPWRCPACQAVLLKGQA